MNSYDNSETWKSQYTSSFNTLCSQYSDVILMQFSAHYHTDEFRLLDGGLGVLLNPSVSPDHTNNPSFRVFTVDQAGILTNYEQYFTDLVFANEAAVNFKLLFSFVLKNL